VIELESGASIRIAALTGRDVQRLAFSADGRILYCGPGLIEGRAVPA
jgi:hypothetical protein